MSVLDVLGLAEARKDRIVGWRREVHQHPELLLDTPLTEALVLRELHRMGIEARGGIGEHGVVGLLRGGAADRTKEVPTVALRADMDALPIQEEGDRPYKSKIPGVMHACGHDGHVAMLLGAAEILSELVEDLTGDVKFIFQPGEEGAGGARLMIMDGCLTDPRPHIIIGAHLGNLWNVGPGHIGVRPGPLMAASDRFDITVRGRGGHGAAPHEAVDPVLVAAHIVLALQTIVSRNTNPIKPVVVTVGVIRAGTANNVIPETAEMQGTVRYVEKEHATLIPQWIEEIVGGVAKSLRATAEVNYQYGYPPLVNDAAVSAHVARSASRIVGEDRVSEADPTMGAEDMSYYLQEIPGTFIAVGSGNAEKGIIYPNHHPKFDVDEDVLPIGSAIFVQSVLDFFAAGGKV